ncbi:MAG: dTDP-4-dehydrorhamnose reductase [Luteolibacter sp.]
MKTPPLSNDPHIVVIGTGGRLGSVLAERFGMRHRVTALGRSQLDLADPDSIAAVLGGMDFTHVFLTAALTAVDTCETHEKEAFAVNGAAPGIIADIASAKGAHVTHIGTDMVFDGLKGSPYSETDRPNPISVYGASKLEGERRVLAASPAHLVARVSWVFGPKRPAFPEWIIQQARASEDVTLPADKIGSPTCTLDLAGWLDALVFGTSGAPAAGIYHLCNSGQCTWRDWGRLCIEAARDSGVPLMARDIRGVPLDSVAAFVAKRPLDSSLATAKFTRATGIRPRPWQVAAREFVMQISTKPS